MSLEIRKLKQADTTTNLSEWSNSKTRTAPNAGEAVEQQKCSFVAGVNINGTATLEDYLAVSFKTKQTLNCMIQQSCSLVFTQMYRKLKSAQTSAHRDLHQLSA